MVLLYILIMKIINYLIILFTISGYSYSCDCIPPSSIEESYNFSDVVFSGQVTNIVENWNDFYKEISIEDFDIWKGIIDSPIIIYSGIDDGICGYNFQINEEYLIYGNYSNDQVWTDICTRTNLLENSNVDLEYLNSLYICENNYTSINGECFYQPDLDVLNIIINNSPNINLILDTNNNGSIEFFELCNQTWLNGRLNILDCGPIVINGNYNWLDISGQIPNSIINWNEIEVLNMSYNNLNGFVSNEICDLNLDFNDPEKFNFQGNDFCPPYPECIEDFMGTQNNFGSGFCELGNCYDVGVNQMTVLELYGDNLVNPYADNGQAQLLVTIHNDGPPCSSYPGLMITADVIGTSFPTEESEISINWWYAIFADDTYFSNISFEISPFVPPNTEITLKAETVIMNCLNEECSEDPYCHDCPSTDPMTITLTVGDLFPSQLGDSNADSNINIIDIVLVVSFILDNTINYYDDANAIQIYLSDINQDINIDVLDIILQVELILNQ